MAPLYEVVSTMAYGLDRLAMLIDSVRRLDRVTVPRIVQEAAAWGIPRDRAEAVVSDLLDRVQAAIDRVVDESGSDDGGARAVIDRQIAVLQADR
jgi:hypothetical protein